MLVCPAVRERAVTNHIEPLKELAAGNIEHDVVCQAACFWSMIIKQVSYVILINKGPAKLLTESATQRTFAAACKTFQGDQPHMNTPLISKARFTCT